MYYTKGDDDLEVARLALAEGDVLPSAQAAAGKVQAAHADVLGEEQANHVVR